MTKTSQIAWRGFPPARSTMTRGELLSPNQPGGLTRLNLLWRAVLDWFAPLGYEDEAGFHYGDSPARQSGQI
jgi:hypothetical protein